MNIARYCAACAHNAPTKIIVLELMFAVMMPALANIISWAIWGIFIWQAGWQVNETRLFPLWFPDKLLLLPLGF
jgi:hypothetical protein